MLMWSICRSSVSSSTVLESLFLTAVTLRSALVSLHSTCGFAQRSTNGELLASRLLPSYARCARTRWLACTHSCTPKNAEEDPCRKVSEGDRGLTSVV